MFDTLINHKHCFLCKIIIQNTGTFQLPGSDFFCNSSFQEYIGATETYIQEKKLHVLREIMHFSDFQKLKKRLAYMHKHRNHVYKNMIRAKTYTDETLRFLYLSAVLQKNEQTNCLEYVVLLIPMDNQTNRDIVLAELTVKEKEIYNLIELGYTSKVIAEKLNLSMQTISTHRRNMHKKFEKLTL